jgi:hypothetical protein
MEDKRQEDLDILIVGKSIKNGIVNFFKSLAWLIDFSLKKALILSLFVVVAVSASLTLYYFQKPYYKSELSVSHIRLDNYYCYEMIRNLNSLLNEERGNSELADELKVRPEVAKAVRNILYAPANLNLARQYSDSMEVLLPFKVEVEIYDNEILPELQTGIMNYLESNEYASKLKQIETQSQNQVEQRIKDEIKEIDSLKLLVNQSIVPRGQGNGIILGEPIDPVSIYTRAMLSYEKLMKLNKEKEFNNSFQVMVGFHKSYKMAGKGLIFHIAMGMLIGYVIGISILLRRHFKSQQSGS